MSPYLGITPGDLLEFGQILLFYLLILIVFALWAFFFIFGICCFVGRVPWTAHPPVTGTHAYVLGALSVGFAVAIILAGVLGLFASAMSSM